MVGSLAKHVLLFFLLIILQVLVIDNIETGHMLTPYVYVLFIILLPIATSPWLILLSAFFLGLSIDLFHYSPGMHASACVMAGFIRTFYFSWIRPQEEVIDLQEPHMYFLGVVPFLVYTFVLTFAHHIVLFSLQTFGQVSFWEVLQKTSVNAGLTLLLIWIFDPLIFYKKRTF